MKKVILFLSILVCLQADEGASKVVFDLTTSSLKSFEQKVLKGIVAHKTHYEGNLKELDVAVVIHGGAYRFFVKDITTSSYKNDKELVKTYTSLKQRIRSMVENYDVNFLMCKAAFKREKLDADDIVDFVTLLPNAAIGLIDKQNEGYAYIPID